jgi:hypothetical protein
MGRPDQDENDQERSIRAGVRATSVSRTNDLPPPRMGSSHPWEVAQPGGCQALYRHIRKGVAGVLWRSVLGPASPVWPEWVGTERGTLRPVSPSPPLPPCVRLSPHTATPGEDFRHLGSADLSETSPALTPYGTSSEDGYFAHLSRCGPSPCTRLSRAPSTMTTLTLSRRLGGFRSCFQPPTSALLPIV